METKVTIFNPIGKFNDIYELQKLSLNIQKAIEITEQYGEKASLEIQNSTNKFLAVLKRANELEKQILLSF